MTERRGDEGFAVVTQSVAGGHGRGPNRFRRIGVAVVAVIAIALIGIGFVGPRLSGRPNFDVAFFATPTPRFTPSPVPTPTITFPNQTPLITPLPVISTPDGVTLQGRLALSTSDSIRFLDLATGETTRITDVGLWRDATFAVGDDDYVCICIADEFDESGSVRTVKLTRITAGATVTTVLDRYHASPESTPDQPDPLIDLAVDAGHRHGLLAVAARGGKTWSFAARTIDIHHPGLGAAVAIGSLALPVLPAPSPGATPVPSDQPVGDNLYLDGPHVRIAPDGRTAFVWANAQRYNDNGDNAQTQGAWRIRLGADGSVEDVTEAPQISSLPLFCPGVGFGGADRLVALCADPNTSAANGQPAWLVRTFDGDGRPLLADIRLPDSGENGYAEPLFDQANHRMYLWDQVSLRIVRIDLDTGEVVAATFDPAAPSANGITSDTGHLAPAWHDADSAVQQNLFESLAGSPDGSRLYAIGTRPSPQADYYSVASLGIFVIDPATLALDAHWAPAANDIWVAAISADRVATGGQPGMDVQGHQTTWEGSLTIRQANDGQILARYGRVSTDMPPVLIKP